MSNTNVSKMTLLNRSGVALFALLLSVPLWGAEASLELRGLLVDANPTELIPVIVSYRGDFDAPGLRRTLRFAERKTRRYTVAQKMQDIAANGNPIADFAISQGAQNVRHLRLISSISMQATPATIDALLTDPNVIQIRTDRVSEAPLPMAGIGAPPQWNIAAIDVEPLWQQGYFGGSTVVAIMDTGVDGQHPALADNWRGGSNSWFDPYGEHTAPYDRSGHGTQVLGIIVGNGTDGSSTGVAPEAKWIAAKIYNDAGTATESDIHLAFEWLLDPDGDPLTDDAPDVVNNSWSVRNEGDCDSTFQPDIDALKAADIAVTFSAGNSGPAPSSGLSPANNIDVLSVGAIDENEIVPIFSSRGPSTCDDQLFPKLVAPGDSITTTDLSFGGNDFYIDVSGTSYSAPHIAGVIALIRDAVPPVSVAEMESALLATAKDLDESGPDNQAGYGLVNATAAVNVLAFPVDMDGDGYGPVTDCDDTDASIYPGATESFRDGIDQDCNGYDMTFKVHQAVYSHDGGSIYLRVTSRYGSDAGIEIVDGGPLAYRDHRKDWFLNGGGVDGYANPTIVIKGIEGELTVKPRKPTPKR
jgi:serine protease AprX